MNAKLVNSACSQEVKDFFKAALKTTFVNRLRLLTIATIALKNMTVNPYS